MVTAMGLRGAPLGNLFSAVAEDEARRVVSAAYAAGLRYFDTASRWMRHSLSVESKR